MPERFKLVATASRGTEDILADELRALGLTGLRQRRGAVEFRGSLVEGLRACIELRTAMRILLPLGEVPAPDANGLYEGLRTLSWTRHLDLRRTFAIDVSGSSEGLTHTLFVAQKAKDAIVDTLRERFKARPDVNVKDPDVRVVVHLHAGQADISLDLAGESLHRRGYRMRPHPASLKETLAAAIVLASGWRGEVPLADPMCGAGTLAIEAALFAEGRAPNARRRFGAERWPSFGDRERAALEELRQTALARPRKPRAAIQASDRDPEAIESLKQNAKRAGVQLMVSVADVRDFQPLDPPGFVITNPPYGGRAGGGGGGKQLKSFFHAIGMNARTLHGHTLCYLAGSEDFESAFAMRPATTRALYNGPIPCELLTYHVR